MGRRSKLTPEVQAAIVDALDSGNYAQVAAEHAGISEATYYSWLDRGRIELRRIQQAEYARDQLPKRAVKAKRVAADKACEPLAPERPYLDFLEAVTRASARAEVAAIASVHAAYGDRQLPDGTIVPGDWRAALQYLERRYPQRWRRRQMAGPEAPSPVDAVPKGAGAHAPEGEEGRPIVGADVTNATIRDDVHAAIRRLAARTDVGAGEGPGE